MHVIDESEDCLIIHCPLSWREWVVALVYVVVGSIISYVVNADGYYAPMALRVLVMGTTLFATYQNLDTADTIYIHRGAPTSSSSTSGNTSRRDNLAKRAITIKRHKLGILQAIIVLPFEEIVLLDLESTDATLVTQLGLGFRLAILGRQGWSIPMAKEYVRGVDDVNTLREMALKISHFMGIKPNPELSRTVTDDQLNTMRASLLRRAETLKANKAKDPNVEIKKDVKTKHA